MQSFEWQQKDPSTPLLSHLIAGSCAGLSEHLSMLPLDNVKTHCQAGSRLPLFSIFSMIYQRGGIKNFYSGSSVLALGCIPAHAIFFSVYEHLKVKFSIQPEDGLRFMLVGAFSSLFHDLIMNPTEVIKQRLQLLRSQHHPITVPQVVQHLYREGGLRSYYRSFPINFLNFPFVSLVVLINEKTKHFMGVESSSPPWKYYFCGWVAGALAAIPTCPLDVIKTKLNTQQCHLKKCDKEIICAMLRKPRDMSNTTFKVKTNKRMGKGQPMTTYTGVKYENIVQTAKLVVAEQGLGGLFSGLKMRVIIQSLSAAISWGTYQLILFNISNKTLQPY